MASTIKGNLKDVDFLHLLSLLVRIKHTGRLTVKTDNEEGYVFVEDGNLKFARFGRKEGFEALLELTRLSSGKFFFEEKVTSINRHFSEGSEEILRMVREELERLRRDSFSSSYKCIKLVEKIEKSVSLSPEQWKIIALSQKFLTIKEISEKMKLDVSKLFKLVESLQQMGIIQLVDKEKFNLKNVQNTKENREKRVSSIFWKALEKELALLVGPVAGSIIEDEIEFMGETKLNFPYNKLPALIERLSQEIDNPNKRLEFQRKMLRLLKQL